MGRKYLELERFFFSKRFLKKYYIIKAQNGDAARLVKVLAELHLAHGYRYFAPLGRTDFLSCQSGRFLLSFR